LWTADAATIKQAAAVSEQRRHGDRRAKQPSHSAPPLPVGTRVLRRRFHTRVRDPATAFRPRWDGPYVVQEFRPPTTYLIVDPARPHQSTLIHRDLLRPTKANSPNHGGHGGAQRSRGR
jgi:hypothetical protein